MQSPDSGMGLVHIYAGNGKGKTSSAVGLAVRAAGCDKRVLFASFLKGAETGEIKSLTALDISVLRCEDTKKFVFLMNDTEKSAYKHLIEAQFDEIKLAAENGRFDIIILDEVLDAIDMELISEAELVSLLSLRGTGIEFVLTGRKAGEALINLAGYYTYFDCKKHPFDSGIKARKGIEY